MNARTAIRDIPPQRQLVLAAVTKIDNEGDVPAGVPEIHETYASLATEAGYDALSIPRVYGQLQALLDFEAVSREQRRIESEAVTENRYSLKIDAETVVNGLLDTDDDNLSSIAGTVSDS